MKKKVVSAILCASMVAGMVVIPGVAVKADDKKLIGVTMPTKDLQRLSLIHISEPTRP